MSSSVPFVGNRVARLRVPVLLAQQVEHVGRVARVEHAEARPAARAPRRAGARAGAPTEWKVPPSTRDDAGTERRARAAASRATRAA